MIRGLLMEFEQSDVNHFDAKLATSGGILENPKETERGKVNQIREEHIRWMLDAGLLSQLDSAQEYVRVTNSGCDFLDSIRQEGIWEKNEERCG